MMKDNEDGIVSILVTLIMTIVLTLLVIGLLQVGVSDVNNAYKRQQSTQAYYLAESGLNNVINLGSYNNLSGCNSINIDNFQIPCITALNNQSTSQYSLSNVGQSKLVPIVGTNNIASITFTWTGSQNNYSGCNTSAARNLMTTSAWSCSAPLLMLNLVSGSLITNGNTAALFSESASKGNSSLYLYPVTSVQPSSYTPSGSSLNDLIPVNCTNGGSCKTTINMANFLTSNSYFIRVTPIYTTTYLTVGAIDTAGATIPSSQIAVDSTGRVGNVLQRLYTRITTTKVLNSISNQGLNDQTPLFAIQSTNDVCKVFQGYYNTATDNSINFSSYSSQSGSVCATYP